MKRGRKPIPPEARRVAFNARVKPETKRLIEARAEREELHVGRLLDALFSNPLTEVINLKSTQS